MASLGKRFPKFIINKTKIDKIAGQYVKELRIATPSVHRVTRILEWRKSTKSGIGEMA